MNDGYKPHLFEYRFDGADWAFDIPARSQDEAKARLRALAWAQYKGELVAKIAVPGGGLIARLLGFLKR